MGAGAGSPEGSFVNNVSLNVSGVELRFPAMVTLPLSNIEAYAGRTVDGVLGYDLFSQFVVEIDYVARIVRLADPNGYVYAGPGESLPFTMLFGRLPTIRARLTKPGRDPVEGQFVLDTGARLALAFSGAFSTAHGLLDSTQKSIPAQLGVGVGGRSDGLLTRLEELQLGRTTMKNLVVGISQDAGGVFKMPGVDGIIGGEVLRRFKPIFNYAHQRISLERNVHFDEPYEHEMLGAFLVGEGPDFKIFKVQNVIANSPAAEAGLREGDVIGDIDNRPASEFTLEQVRQMFRQEGKEYLLRVNRVEEVLRFKTRVKLRRLI